jgi:hypothetical protein
VIREAELHPAVYAWARLTGSAPDDVTITRLSRKRKSYVYRLTGEGLPNGSLIAKLCRFPDAAVERTVYEDVLSEIALPTIGYYGSRDEEETGSTWLFIEDVAGQKFVPQDEGHRALAGRWLGTLHSLTAGLGRAASLPGRSAADYLNLLDSVNNAIAGNLANTYLTFAYRGVLQTFLGQLDQVRAQWAQITAICGNFPPTLVHGDLAAKNVQIREEAGGQRLLPFDWEGAGWGVPAADLAQLSDRGLGKSISPDLCEYVLHTSGPSGDLESVRELANVGTIFRVLHMVDWQAWMLPTEGIGKTVGAIRGYTTELERALTQLTDSRVDFPLAPETDD